MTMLIDRLTAVQLWGVNGLIPSLQIVHVLSLHAMIAIIHTKLLKGTGPR